LFFVLFQTVAVTHTYMCIHMHTHSSPFMVRIIMCFYKLFLIVLSINVVFDHLVQLCAKLQFSFCHYTLHYKLPCIHTYVYHSWFMLWILTSSEHARYVCIYCVFIYTMWICLMFWFSSIVFDELSRKVCIILLYIRTYVIK